MYKLLQRIVGNVFSLCTQTDKCFTMTVPDYRTVRTATNLDVSNAKCFVVNFGVGKIVIYFILILTLFYRNNFLLRGIN